ncbi:MAG TPA: DUF423 domain-containing protein [Opitutaceae bacterium]|nr:DUF423 domain-containing protein [Opitutaceae bacterium]
MKPRTILLAAGFFGATGVALGAFGAHALRTMLTEFMTRDRWETAVFYQLVHAVALFVAATWSRRFPGSGSSRIAWAARFWTAGICLFSGSLYLLSVTLNAPLWFKIAIPPLGGTAFVAGWLCIVAAAFGKEE